MLIFGIIVFIVTLLIVYIVTGIALSEFYETKNVSASFWSLILLFTPILNTITLIIVDSESRKNIKEFFSFKKFFKEFEDI